MRDIAAIILAAGKGVRMNSDLPKVLHMAAGRTLLHWVTAASGAAGIARQCLVVGHGAEEVRAAMGSSYDYALQQPQLGTGHAVQQALPVLAPLPAALLVLAGDTPLLSAETLRSLIDFFTASGAACTILTAELDNPGSYGRIIRDGAGAVAAIVEARDADPQQLAIREVNSGVYCFSSAALSEVIYGLHTENAQQEYYLTDAVAAIRARGGIVNAYVAADSGEIAGVNDRIQLAAAGKALWARKNCELMLSGVTIIDPDTAYIDADVQIGRDTVLEPQVYIHGNTHIGSQCHIGPGVKMVDCRIGDRCDIGPFAYLRPGTVLADKVKAGHFVEIKKSFIGAGSKVPHLTYIGDTEIGERVNIGCGTITCNYDGMNKHKTVIKDEAFIGSNTNLIAPVTVGERATVAAGSTITEDVPPDSLGIARGRQKNLEGWAQQRDPRFAGKSGK